MWIITSTNCGCFCNMDLARSGKTAVAMKTRTKFKPGFQRSPLKDAASEDARSEPHPVAHGRPVNRAFVDDFRRFDTLWGAQRKCARSGDIRPFCGDTSRRGHLFPYCHTLRLNLISLDSNGGPSKALSSVTPSPAPGARTRRSRRGQGSRRSRPCATPPRDPGRAS